MRSPVFLLLFAALCATSIAQKPRIHVDKAVENAGVLSLTPKSGPIKITFSLDEPILCPDDVDVAECEVVIKLTNSHPDVLHIDTCWVKWAFGEHKQKRVITARPVASWADQQQVKVTLQTEPAESKAFYYSGFNPADIMFQSTPRRGANCRGTGDPHYTTFDGKYWHEYGAGQMVFYSTVDKKIHDFEMQARVYSYPARHCGIVGREDQNAVIIDQCDGSLNVEPRFACPHCEGNPKITFSPPNVYTVNFPSGSWMQAHIHGRYYMNVYAGAPGLDHGNTQGMCGNFDGNPNNDAPGYMITSISGLWPAPEQQIEGDLFSWRPTAGASPVTSELPPYADECDYIPPPVLRPLLSHSDAEDITDKFQKAVEQNGGVVNEFVFEAIDPTPDQINAKEVDQDTAQQICKHISESKVATECAPLGLEVGTFVTDCIQDIMLMGNDPGFVSDAIEAMETACADLVSQKSTFVIEDGKLEEQVQIDAAIADALCPAQCNDNGVCKAGVCDCFEGFLGRDCAHDSTKPPQINTINNPLCDTVGQEGCPREITIFGENFFRHENKQILCRFGEEGNSKLMVGVYMGLQILCPVPDNMGHKGANQLTNSVEVSNDGVLWSNPLKFTWYDSHCQVCKSPEECGVNPESCLIEGECMLHGASDPINPCKECTSDSFDSYSFVYHNHLICGPRFSSKNYIAEIRKEIKAGAELARVDALNDWVANDTQIKYSIEATAEHFFQIDEATGVISPIKDIVVSEYPKNSEGYRDLAGFHNLLTIVATDHAGNSASADFVVELLDQEEAPLFKEKKYDFAVDEDVPTGSIIGKLEPSREVAGMSYSIYKPDDKQPNKFIIGESDGVLQLKSSEGFDFELQSQYFLQVRAEKGGLSHVVAVQIDVLDKNDVPLSISIVPSHIAENSPVGAVVGKVVVDDQDVLQSHNIELIADGNGDFSIMSNASGFYITVAEFLDFETLAFNPINITVRATDVPLAGKGQLPLSLTTTVDIQIDDVNEPPYDLSISVSELDEDAPVSESFATVSVKDHDEGDEPECGLRSSVGGRFLLEDNELILAGKIDHEAMGSHTIEIVCLDNGVPPLEISKSFEIVINDVNDAPEKIELVSQEAIKEDSLADTFVGTVSATDMDEGAGDIAFEVVTEEGEKPKFKFSGVVSCETNPTGQSRTCTQGLYTASKTLDFETYPKETVNIRATDSLGKSRILPVFVQVTDVNEPPLKPRWEVAEGSEVVGNFIREDAKPGDVVGVIVTQDQDQGQTNVIELLGGNNFFVLKPFESRRRSAGAVGDDQETVTKMSVVVADGAVFDYEQASSHTFTIRVTDNGEPPLSEDFEMTVNIQDLLMVVDLSPNTDSQGLKLVEISDNVIVVDEGFSGALLDVRVTDPDTPPRTDLIETITLNGPDADKFKIEDGKLILEEALDTNTVELSVTINVEFTKKDDSTVSADAPEKLVLKHTVKVADVLKRAKSDEIKVQSTAKAGTLLATLNKLNANDYNFFVEDSKNSVVLNIDEDTGEVVLTLKSSPIKNSGLMKVVAGGAKHTVTIKYVPKSGGRMRSYAMSYAVEGSGSPSNPGGSVDNGSSSGSNAGLIAAVAVICVVLVLVGAVLLYRHRQQAHKPLFGENEGMMSAFNPTYAMSENETYTGGAEYAAVDMHNSTTFRPGMTSAYYPWYQPDMSRQDCNDFLIQCADGAFVVRDSKATPGWHMLGVKVGNRVMHEKIKMNDDGSYELLPSNNHRQPRFASLPELIEHYTVPRPGVEFKLFLAQSMDNPMYGAGMPDGSDGYAAYGYGRDADAPNLPLKEREVDTVAQVAAHDMQEDIYTNTAEAKQAVSNA